MALLERELSGLDHLELEVPQRPSRISRVWSGSWPKMLAAGIGLAIWQIVVWTGWKPKAVLPGPVPVFKTLFEDWDTIWEAMQTTLLRGVKGFALAVLIGGVIGALVSQIRVLRLAVGSLITGLQTMPSIAWFPLAILLFGLNESAILFVVVLGAAPSVANGLILGVDHIQPVLLRAGRVLGAKRLTKFRYVVLPAALPSFVGGLKQGWAFAWRSLLAGELLVLLGKFSLGQQLQINRDLADSEGLLAVMIVILAIGIVIDSLVFGVAERAIRRRYGLVDAADEI